MNHVSFILSLAILFSNLTAQAKTLIVSDIDDTIKIAGIRDFDLGLGWSLDSHSAFLGMPEVYRQLAERIPDAEWAYLSNAPSWYMAKTHTEFLQFNQFPSGQYIPRAGLFSGDHKIKTLRELIHDGKPDQVIMIGDNGEKDPIVYDQIRNEFANQGISFRVYIHSIYRRPEFGGHLSSERPNQFLFVSAYDLALEWVGEQLLTSEDANQIGISMQNQLEPQETHSQAQNSLFPSFADCMGFVFTENPKENRYIINILNQTCSKAGQIAVTQKLYPGEFISP